MKPGIKTIITGTVLFLVGGFVLPLLFILPLIHGDSNEVQFKAPGTIEAAVEVPGRYYLWNDFKTVYQGKSYDRSESVPDGTEIRIRNTNGELLKFVSDNSFSSTGGGSSKNSIGYVQVESPGKLKIEITGGNEERIFSFSQSQLLKMFRLIAGGCCLSLLVGVGGFGMIIWGIVKLVKADKKTDQRAAPDGGPTT